MFISPFISLSTSSSFLIFLREAGVHLHLSSAFAFREAKDIKKYHVHIREAISRAFSLRQPGLIAEILCKYLSKVDPESLSDVLDTLQLVEHGFDRQGFNSNFRGVYQIFIRLLVAHIQLLIFQQSATTTRDAIRRTREAINSAGESCPSSLRVYAETLNLCAEMQCGQADAMQAALITLKQTTNEILTNSRKKDGDSKMERKPLSSGLQCMEIENVNLKWPGQNANTLEALSSLCQGLADRSQAKLQDSTKVISNALDSLKKNRSSERDRKVSVGLQVELQAVEALNSLTCCEYPKFVRVIGSLIKSLRSSGNENESYRLSQRRMLVKYLCARYLDIVGNARTANEHFKSIWGETSTRTVLVPVAFAHLIKLQYLWNRVQQQKNVEHTIVCALEEARAIQQKVGITGNAVLEVYALLVQGTCQRFLGNVAEARVLCRKSLTISNGLQNKLATTVSLGQLGALLMDNCRAQGEPRPEIAWTQAQEALQSALLLAARMKDGYGQLLILNLFIACLENTGDREKRRKLLEFYEKRKAHLFAKLGEARELEEHK